jgi:hypothetical protein
MYPTMNDAILKNLMFLSVRVKRFDLSPAVLSIIAAEMYFRGPLHRLIEYCAWVALWCFDAKTVGTLSVGVAQIQLKRWKELGYICSYSPSFLNLKIVSSVDNNYAACRRYLTHFGSSLEPTSSRELSELYSGRARTFHVKVIESAFSAAQRISLTKASSRARGRC